MSEPLSKTQQMLRGRRLAEMTNDQLLDWIDACNRMEEWKHTPSKSRQKWKLSNQAAKGELDRRNARIDIKVI